MLPYHVVDKYGDRRIALQRSEGDESGWIGINSRALQSWRAFRTGIHPLIFRTKQFLVSPYFSVSLFCASENKSRVTKNGFHFNDCMHPLHGTLDNTKGKWIQKISGLLDSADNARLVSFRAKDFENAFCNEINGIFLFQHVCRDTLRQPRLLRPGCW